MSDEIKPTSGRAMREMREAGMVLPFPSGNYYRVRSVGAPRLLRRGKLPNVLLSFVTDAIWNGMDEEKLDKFRTLQEREELGLEFLDSLRIVCEEMFMEPRIVENPQADDEISIEDLAIIDQWVAFERAFGLVREYLPFRPEPATDVAVVAQLEDVPQASQ